MRSTDSNKWRGPLAIACFAFIGLTGPSQAAMRHQATNQPPPSAASPLPEKPKEYPVGTTWVLKSFNDKPVPVSDDLTFSVDCNFRGSGYSGCNMWSATVYPVKDQKFLVGPVAITKKQCDKDKTQFEVSYLSAIHSGPSWNVVGGDLILKTQSGTLVFQRSF